MQKVDVIWKHNKSPARLLPAHAKTLAEKGLVEFKDKAEAKKLLDTLPAEPKPKASKSKKK